MSPRLKRNLLARLTAGTLFGAVLLLGVPSASAQEFDRNDINLSRLYQFVENQGNWSRFSPEFQQACSDPTAGSCFDARNAERSSLYRSLMSQLGLALSPAFLAPAETTGYSGFAISVKTSITTIDNKSDYWENGTGNPFSNKSPHTVLPTIGVEVRKGMWIPGPSFELGAGFVHVLESHLFGISAMAKLAVNEGRSLHAAVPAVAARFYGVRVVGTSQLDMTILSLDLSLSWTFGIAGTFNLTPYVGYNVLWIFADSEVIDTNPEIDSLQCAASGDPVNDPNCRDRGSYSYSEPIRNGQFCSNPAACGENYVFDDQNEILRHRIFFGFRMIVYHFAFTFEAAFSLAGNTKDTLSFTSAAFEQISDRAKFQQTYSFSIAWDY